MKKLICAVVVLVILGGFTACDTNQNTSQSNLDFVAHYFRAFRNYYYHYDIGVYISDYNHDIAELLVDMYDDYFFAENVLVFFNIKQPTTALEYGVGSVQANGNIVMRPAPHVAAGRSISHWTIVIELNNDFIPNSFNINFGESRRQWWADSATPVQIIKRDGIQPNIIERQNSVIPGEFVYAGNSPVRILDNVREFYPAATWVYAIMDDNSLWGWHNNNMTQTAKYVWIMDNASVILDANSAIDDAGTLWRWEWSGHTIAPVMDNVRWATDRMIITTDDVLWRWGENRYGLVGDGTRIDRYRPVPIMENVREATLGWYSVSAITNDGVLWSWGRNSSGNLGDGTYEDGDAPVKIAENVNNVLQDLEVRRYLTANGREVRHVVPRTGARPLIPMPLYITRDNVILGYGWEFENVANYFIHSTHHGMSRVHNQFALTFDGELFAWGFNENGLLGDGTTEYRDAPVRIMNDVADVFVGDDYIFALQTDGALWAWGENENGQLGDGTYENRLYPVRIMNNIATVSVNNNQNFALAKDGGLWMWGPNTTGQDFSFERVTIFRTQNSPRNHRPMLQVLDCYFGDAPEPPATALRPIMDNVRYVGHIFNPHVAYVVREDESLWQIVEYPIARGGFFYRWENGI